MLNSVVNGSIKMQGLVMNQPDLELLLMIMVHGMVAGHRYRHGHQLKLLQFKLLFYDRGNN